MPPCGEARTGHRRRLVLRGPVTVTVAGLEVTSPKRTMATARYEREQEGRRRAQGPWNLKTRLCKQWKATGRCRYGDDCHFAHGAAELRVFEEWDDEQWSDADGHGDDEDIPCIPESAARSPLPPTSDDVSQQIQVARAARARDNASQARQTMRTAAAVHADTPRHQGVEIGGGWVRYWDDVHCATYFFHPGLSVKGRVRTTPPHSPPHAHAWLVVCVKRWRAGTKSACG